MDQLILQAANTRLTLENEKLKNELVDYTNKLKDMSDLLIEFEQNQARLKMVMQSLNLGTWIFNPAQGKLDWSEECKRIYGVPHDIQITFEVFSDHIHPDDKEFVLSEIEKAMSPKGGGNYDITFRIIRYNDKAIRWIRSQGKVYFDIGGLADRFIGTVIDITDVKVAEEHSAYLGSIIESSDDAILSKTLDGIITSWNASAKRLFGYEAEEVVGQPVLILIPEDRQDEEPQILARLRKGERVDHFETKRITKDKQLIDLSLTISPIKDSKGNIIGISKIARDITDKKREEQKRNDFIAMVSHELKTPLTSIKSYIQILLARATTSEDSFEMRALSRTDSQVKKMVTMINDFLSLARLEEAKIQLSKKSFDLRTLISEVVSDAQVLSEYENIHVINGSAMVFADPDKIGQVMTNLISNAIKYSPNKGKIIVEFKLLDDEVTVSVTDHGIGIPLKHQARLFERFYRVDNGTVPIVTGFGVGLYLASELLRYHNSRLSVKSEEGAGSTFSFNLSVVG